MQSGLTGKNLSKKNCFNNETRNEVQLQKTVEITEVGTTCRNVFLSDEFEMDDKYDGIPSHP
jgi:hypothetical protein